jgi:hypothetical protein
MEFAISVFYMFVCCLLPRNSCIIILKTGNTVEVLIMTFGRFCELFVKELNLLIKLLCSITSVNTLC